MEKGISKQNHEDSLEKSSSKHDDNKLEDTAGHAVRDATKDGN